MAANVKIITTEESDALQKELEYLKTTRRKEVAERIKEARGFGDLSENSEYDEAKEQQGWLESRIAEVELILKNAQVLQHSDIDTNRVSIGTFVTLEIGPGKTKVYRIVGSTDANPFEGKISEDSPLGHALIGRAVNETVQYMSPGGERSVKILKLGK